MLRVSLIALRGPGSPSPARTLAACRAGLEESGHDVEVLIVSDPTAGPDPEPVEPWAEWMMAPGPGLSEAMVAGLRASRGDLLIVLDAARAYAPDDVFNLVARLSGGEADLMIAAGPGPRIVARAFRRALGSADPCSGLVGITRQAAIEADRKFAPIGSRFAIELLARVRGRKADVGVTRVAANPPRSIGLDDVRLAKRLADDRFGTASRLLQFCFVGASGMVVDLTCYALFQALLSRSQVGSMRLPMVDGPAAPAAAAVLAIATALTWNFSLNRRLTFNDARRGSIGVQYLRYVLSNLLGIGVSLTLRLALPGTFGYFARHRLAAAVAGIVAATGISFSMARWFVFGRKARPTAPPARRGVIRADDRTRTSIAGCHHPSRSMTPVGRISPGSKSA